ncbi:MAG: EamA family transporter RarD [Litorimonas sp.]
MSAHIQNDSPNDGRNGLFAGLAAYTFWGLFPIYFILTKSIPALELLGYRILWSVPFCFLIIAARKQLPDIIKIIKNVKIMALLTLAAVAIALNWGVYIWAVQHEQIFQASLGYYINPLIYVIVGVVFFKETLSLHQTIAITLACIGVLILTIYGGEFPAISLILAISFTIYGIIKRIASVRAMTGLFIETTILFVPTIIYMTYLFNNASMQFTQQGLEMDVLILLSGPFTVLPLLAFSFAARRIKLSTLGVLQFIGPSLQFVCAYIYGETLTLAHILCFTFIWTGVFIFCWDAIQKSRKAQTV